MVPRGAFSFRLTERRRETFSAVLRSYDELLGTDKAGLAGPRSPRLFSAFLDTRKITVGRTLVFTVELSVSSTGYTINGKLWNGHVEGDYLFRDTLTLRLSRTADGFAVRYLSAEEKWSEATGTLAVQDGAGYRILLASPKGFRGTLQLDVQQP